MKKNRIIIKPESSLEALLCLAPTVAALKRAHPDSEIGILGEKCFAEAAALLPGLDYYLDEDPPEESCTQLDFSNITEESSGAENLEWRAYLQGCSFLDSTNPYHRIDLFRKTAGIECIDVNFELAQPQLPADSIPESLSQAECLRIALCASSLGIDGLQAVLEGLSRIGVPAVIHLLGTVAEKRKASLLLSAWDGRIALVDLCGRQSSVQVAETLRLCDITIAGPGLSSIMSSGYGTFTICVSESRNPLHYPYGHGHLVVQSTESAEFPRALSGLVQEIVDHATSANNGSVPTLEQWRAFADARIDNCLSKVRLFATQRIEILLDEKSSYTEMYLRPLLFMGADIQDIFHSFHRLMWEHSLSGRSIRTNDLEILGQGALEELAAVLKPAEQLYELANFGHTYSSYVHSSLVAGDIARAKQESDRLQEVEELLYALAKSNDFMAPLCAFFDKSQRLLSGESPIILAEQMGQQFEQMKLRVLVLLDLARTLFHNTLRNESPLAEQSAQEGRS